MEDTLDSRDAGLQDRDRGRQPGAADEVAEPGLGSDVDPNGYLSVDTQDTDSALGDAHTLRSATTSIASSIFESVEENGRTYHRYKQGSYLLPNDELELERLDMQHQLCLMTFYGELWLAPIKEPRHVLDIGTGTGIWAIDVGSVPPNCQFEIDDAEDEWTYTTKFDLIHGRLLFSCFRDAKQVLQSAFNQLKPGGYLEMQDVVLPLGCVDDSINGTALERWINLRLEASANLGKDWTCAAKYATWMREIGYVDVVEKPFQWPTNTWAKGKRFKTLGAWYHQNLMDGLHGMSIRVLTKGLGMSKEDVELTLVDVRNDIRNKSIHAYCQLVVVYGRKPLEGEVI